MPTRTGETCRAELCAALDISGELLHEVTWEELLKIVRHERQTLATIRAAIDAPLVVREDVPHADSIDDGGFHPFDDRAIVGCL